MSLQTINPIGLVTLVIGIGLIGYLLYRVIRFVKPKDNR
ncbi:hypothetical protein C8J48_0219 [Desmospora activa DSM 45169]|uniref:Uncharacterized protein n=1 Tax=Desmospora activa DSM 45169 TaxID=1121389 RepID=A0A2T4Z6Z8_9BACL|nr:hypothetical protein C8J48_0219 [Desmospora activa DSM 45169]